MSPDQQSARLGQVLRDWATPPPEAIGKLPKPTRRENQKGTCKECGGYHGLPAVHLDYVGHAWVTRALIEADPLWTWEPMAVTDDGEPRIANAGGHLRMWIRLTVHGKTLPAVGTCSANKPEPEKELIGSALRNGAMRFGIALSLWAKDEWDDLGETGAQSGGVVEPDVVPPATAPTPPSGDRAPLGDVHRVTVDQLRKRMSPAQKGAVRAFMATHGIPSLAAATVDQLSMLAVECERVLAEGVAS